MILALYLENIYNYFCKKWKFIISIYFFLLLILLIILFVLWTVISFFILKWLKKNIHENYYFNNYTNKCIETLNKYGNLPIKNIYLTRQPINYYVLKLFNIISLFEYEKKLKKYIEQNKCKSFFHFHTSVIVEIELPNKFRKFIIIDKSNYINISANNKTYQNQDIIKINRKKNKLTLNTLLENTRKRLGNDKYFNWHLYNNNCLKFTKEILISLNKKNKKYYNFIYKDNFSTTYKSSDFKLHILNCFINLINFFEEFTNIYHN